MDCGLLNDWKPESTLVEANLQRAPNTGARAKVNGSQEQNKVKGELSTGEKETNIKLQKAPDTRAQAQV